MIYCLLVIFIILIDQWAKKKALTFFTQNDSPYLFNKFFQLRLAKNSGAFYGIFKNKRKLLISLSFISILACWFLLYFGIRNGKMPLFNIGLSFIIGGAIGNLIDRIKKGYVLDFLYMKIKRGPVFNFADVFIFLGAFILLYLEIFYSVF